MAEKDYRAFIVEGESREPSIIVNISEVFFAHKNFKIITLPAGQNIYKFWKKLKEDDFDTDIIEVLREENKELEEQLVGLSRNDFSEVSLFFDYDGHQNNLGVSDGDSVIEQMLKSFDNETENGKLYISYPMVEALRDFEPEVCGCGEKCYVMVSDIESYKKWSAENSKYPQFKKYDFEIWKAVMDVFVMRLLCLMNRTTFLNYKQYEDDINPYEIFKLQKQAIDKSKVFVLSAFPEFLLDYLGEKLWKNV